MVITNPYVVLVNPSSLFRALCLHLLIVGDNL